MVAIGISLGKPYSRVAVAIDGDQVTLIPNDRGETKTLSCYTPPATSHTPPQIGRLDATSVYDIQRLIGRKFNDPVVQENLRHWPFRVKAGSDFWIVIESSSTTLSPEQVMAALIQFLKQAAETKLAQPIRDAVIAVPSHFSITQRNATRDAGTLAGLNVTLIDEAVAAVLAQVPQLNPYQFIMVFSLGSQNFEISLVEIDYDSHPSVKSFIGPIQTGGDDFDQRLVDWCLQDIKKRWNKAIFDNTSKEALRLSCKQARENLSEAIKSVIEVPKLFDNVNYTTTITRTTFEILCSDLFNNCLTCVDPVLKDANVSIEQIDSIVFVGGSTKMPRFNLLAREFKASYIATEEAIAFGAARYATQGCVSTPSVRKSVSSKASGVMWDQGIVSNPFSRTPLTRTSSTRTPRLSRS
eukprot:Blabericola_migrator_1__1231@NODE_1315_length_4835_cov_207_490982_g885_i0_p1_GENE_NODE_1315_length_4835_cov_207_490982_g885_i0NODE_1315_length_4835_cov_207_490982_g885_i0_p1_ORF_typecomplete_len411_score61_28HSP70/PF00012_20/3_6e64MreB_Mbl/PF06723_13/4_2e17_NODE_1315_length_4835_cov_207_490982_g885_i011812413